MSTSRALETRLLLLPIPPRIHLQLLMWADLLAKIEPQPSRKTSRGFSTWQQPASYHSMSRQPGLLTSICCHCVDMIDFEIFYWFEKSRKLLLPWTLLVIMEIFFPLENLQMLKGVKKHKHHQPPMAAPGQTTAAVWSPLWSHIFGIFFYLFCYSWILQEEEEDWQPCDSRSKWLVIRNLFSTITKNKIFQSIFICYINCTGIGWRVLYSKWFSNMN